MPETVFKLILNWNSLVFKIWENKSSVKVKTQMSLINMQAHERPGWMMRMMRICIKCTFFVEISDFDRSIQFSFQISTDPFDNCVFFIHFVCVCVFFFIMLRFNNSRSTNPLLRQVYDTKLYSTQLATHKSQWPKSVQHEKNHWNPIPRILNTYPSTIHRGFPEIS